MRPDAPMSAGKRSSGTASSRINNACEACRAAKVKCQPSFQAGICQRCLEFKRECVYRTGPRTRRPRNSRLNLDPALQVGANGGGGGNSNSNRPSKTFSINFDMVVPDRDPRIVLDALAMDHADYIENLFPLDEDDGPSPWPSPEPTFGGGNHGVPSPPGSSSSDANSNSNSNSHSEPTPRFPTVVPISDIGLKPQFNLDSASRLLKRFRGMLQHFPCIVLPEDATVPMLAQTRPFVLLAILSVASGAESLQGRALYDDEFRKILSLKYTAGGERSVELLQGLLIYAAWYPFHLRPKNTQAFQYVRMAIEMTHDLEIAQPPTEALDDMNISSDRIEAIRAYLACFYLVSSFALLIKARYLVTWSKFTSLCFDYSSWTATCCDTLERVSDHDGDKVLAWLVRCEYIVRETNTLDRTGLSLDSEQEQKTRFMLMGLESQFRQWRSRIPLHLMSAGSPLQIATSFTDLYLHASPVLRFRGPVPGLGPSFRSPPPPPPATAAEPGSPGKLLRPDLASLTHCLPVLCALYEMMVSLPNSLLLNITSMGWTKLVQASILGLRLSLPLPPCPGWDDAAAREVLQFGSFLDRFSAEAEQEREQARPAKGMNVLEAGRVVFKVVKQKYQVRLAKVVHPGMSVGKGARGCPMLDGSLENWFPRWDPDLRMGGTPAETDGGSGRASVTGHLDLHRQQQHRHQQLQHQQQHHQQQQQQQQHQHQQEEQHQHQPHTPRYHDMWATMTMGWSNDQELADAMAMMPPGVSPGQTPF